MKTKSILVVLAAIALCAVPVMAIEPQPVGGDFGRSWLNNYGDVITISDKTEDFWSWGTIPKGQMLVGGKLTPIGTSTIYYPGFLANETPLLLNRSAPSPYFSPDFASPYFMNDPWMVAQITGQPVVFREM